MKKRMYPNYTDCFYYNEGNDYIKLVRKVGFKVIYRNTMEFENPQQASDYFEEM